MKKLLVFALLAMSLTIFNGCQKEFNNSSIEYNDELASKSLSFYESEYDSYNKFIKKFAKSLSKSLDQKDLRKELKKEAMLKIDGDYDIIWKGFKDKMIKTTKGNKTVKEFISEKMYGKDKEKKIKELDDFNEKFKKFQISVPVKCEKWDTENYTPLVAFMTADYNEKMETIDAYDANGNLITLSNKIIPKQPVIVIGLNERSNENGEILEHYLKSIPIGGCEPLNAPSSLSATTYGNGIQLNWDQTLPSSLTCIDGYRIYRKSSEEGADFVSIGTNNDYTDKVYYDSDFVSEDKNLPFSYYVVAFGPDGESPSSNTATATAPSPPNPVLSFEASNYAYGTVFLNWNNDNSDYHSETKIYRAIVGSNPQFSPYLSFTDNTNDYFDNNLTPGTKYHYKIVHINGIDESNGRYDFVKVPYRDINSGSPVYITNISFTDWELEQWPAGSPEFQIWVGNADKVTGFKDFVVGGTNKDSGMEYNFSSRTKSQNFSQNALFSWNPGYWEDLISIKVIEHDEEILNQNESSSLSVKINYKDTLNANITGAITGSLDFNFEYRSEDCGTAYYNYYDNTSYSLSTGFKWGVTLQLDDSN